MEIEPSPQAMLVSWANEFKVFQHYGLGSSMSDLNVLQVEILHVVLDAQLRAEKAKQDLENLKGKTKTKRPRRR